VSAASDRGRPAEAALAEARRAAAGRSVSLGGGGASLGRQVLAAVRPSLKRSEFYARLGT